MAFLYAKEINSETKEYEVPNQEDAKAQGLAQYDVEFDVNSSKWYLAGNVPPVPIPTDAEVVAVREQLYASVSDPMFASYDQGGEGTLDAAINAKAQIQFDNKKSTQSAMTFADFVHKVTTEYALSKARKSTELTYEYQENSGNSDVIVSDKTINLVRATSSCNVVLPKISKVQTVKIDNVSDDSITILPASGDNLEGLSGNYVLPAKSVVEFIAEPAALNWDLYTAPLEVQATITVEDLFKHSFSGISNLQIGKDLVLSKVNNNTVKIEAAVIDKRPSSLYASLSVPEKIVARENSPQHYGVLWFDNIISAVRTNMLDIRRNEKAYGIQDYVQSDDPAVTGGIPFLVLVKLSLRGKAPADGYVQVDIVDKDTGITNTFTKKEYKQGEDFGDIKVWSIIKAGGVQYQQIRVHTNMPDNETIMLNDYTDGNSCILITALTGEEASESLLKYEIDNNERLLIGKQYLGELYNASYLLSHPVARVVGEAEQGETDSDGSHFYNKRKMGVEIANNSINFTSEGSELCLWNWGYILPAERTVLLRGKEIRVDAVVTNPDTALNVQMVKWTGAADKYSEKIITDVINDTDVFEPSWSLVDKEWVVESPSRTAVSKTFIVPSDAENIGFIVSPIEEANPLSASIEKFVVSVAEPSEVWLVKGIK